MREFERFVLYLLIFSLLVCVVLFFFIPSLPDRFRFDEWWKIIVFFFIITSAFHYGLLRSTSKRPNAITIYYMATTTIKLLLYVGIIISYSLMHKDKSAGFIVSFFIMYFFYTAFEVSVLYKKFSSPAIKKPDGE